jgi:hypothetical protein
MTLGRPAILGIIFGVLIGGIYIVLQRHKLRQTPDTQRVGGVVTLVPGALGRLAFLVVTWWLVFKFTDADKYWLTGALVVTYTAPLLVQVRELVFPKK